jgi:RNase P protein component
LANQPVSLAKPPSQRRASKTAFFGQWLSLHILRAAPSVAAGTLYVATPKKLAKRAIHRNMVRRVIKEQWRLHRLHQDLGGSAYVSAAGETMPKALSLLVRLHKMPGSVKTHVAPSALHSLKQRLPDGAFKRAIAADFNQQLLLLMSALRTTA